MTSARDVAESQSAVAPWAGWSLEGRVALVTGSTRGLGRSIALALARAGADTDVASRKQEACDETAAALTAATGRTAFGIAAHLGRWTEVESLAERAWSAFGRVDVVVNNAGMSPLYPSLPEVSEELFDKVVNVNLKGPFRLSALLGSRMADGDGGSIINISSVGSIRPAPDALPYVAAKAGLNTLTIGFAQAYAPKVRVNTIMPGPFATDIATNWSPEVAARVARSTLLERVGHPDEIVGTALYLASDASTFITGATIIVDGGMAATL